jgi:hypothetical protein
LCLRNEGIIKAIFGNIHSKKVLTIPLFFSIILFQFNNSLEEIIMSKSVYTQAMCEKMATVQPLNAEICSTLAQEFGLTQRSVIAKAKSLGLDYTVKAKPARKKQAPSKADVVQAIAKAVDCEVSEIDGLVKAPMVSLCALLSHIA